MIKKIIKFSIATCLIFAVLVLAAFFTLKKMYPPTKLKTIAQDYVSKKLQRQFTFDSISFTWIGFTLTNASLSENPTFEEGTFVKADKLTAHVAVRPLLHKRIQITTIQADGLQVNIKTRKDGSFNFDTLTSTADQAAVTAQHPTPQNAPQEEPLTITAQRIELTDCDLVYMDEQTGMRTALNNLNIEITNFNLNQPFETTINFVTDISRLGKPTISLPISLNFSTFLANGEMPQAYATISNATAQYKTIRLNLQGNVKNFEVPELNLMGSLEGLNNTVLSDIASGLAYFSLPRMDLILQAKIDLKSKIASVSQVKLAVQDSYLTTKGTVAWNTPNLTYNLMGSLTALVDQLVQMTNTWEGFSPTGTIHATFNATEKKNYTDVNAKLQLQNVSFLYDPFTLSEVNGDISLAHAQDISSSALSGKLNKQPFTGNFSYKTSDNNTTDLVLNLNLDKLVLSKWPSSNKNSSDEEKDAASGINDVPDSSVSTPMNLQTNINIGGISVPYLESKGLTLTTNLINVTDTMAQTNGTINFTLQAGKIMNLDNFTKVNKIIKILLLPLGIIEKVTVLLGINIFPDNDKDQGATLPFTQAEGAYTFTNGVMNIDKTVFNSNVTDILATGTANFQTDELDMHARATALTQAAPISFKITGTVSKPKGKLDVVNTVTSVVGGFLNGTAAKSATNGTVSLTQETTDAATDLLKGISNLFKKKEPQEEEEKTKESNE